MDFSDDVLSLNPSLAKLSKAKLSKAKRAQITGFGKSARTTAFRSKLEKRAWEEWVLTQGAMIAQYEPFTLHLAGGRYTPDFSLAFESGERWIVEVKRDWKSHPSGRSSKHSLKQAAVEFGWLGSFYALMPDGDGWSFTEISRPAHYRRVATELSE